MNVPPQILETLATHGQEHLLKFWDDLSKAEKQALLNEIEREDFGELREAFQASAAALDAAATSYTYHPPALLDWSKPRRLPLHESVPAVMTRLEDVPMDVQQMWLSLGYEMIADASVAAVLMAGGQGTRLGWNEPKGAYPAGPVSRKALFQLFAERIIRVTQLAKSRTPSSPQGASVCHPPLYIMTADHNHEATIAFFEKHNYFGLEKSLVKFFQQRMIPCTGLDGKILLEKKYKLARSPNGNGGVFEALLKSGMIRDMQEKGIKGLHIFGVDNVLVKVLDPLFLGYVEHCGVPVGNKCVKKAHGNEAVGVQGWRTSIGNKAAVPEACVVEYSELPEALRKARDEDGSFIFSAGNICNHYFTVDFIERVVLCKNNACQYHIAKKRVPCVDLETGNEVKPSSPNGIKSEFFIFDAFTDAECVAALEVSRSSEFAPIKNATGDDSPESAARMMSALHRKWLSAKGVNLENGDGSYVEISPLLSYGGEALEKFGGRTFRCPVHIDEKTL